MSWQWGWIRGFIPFLLNLLLVLNIICWPIALLIPTTDAVLRVFVEFVFGHKRQKESEEECVRTWLGRKDYDSDGNEFYVSKRSETSAQSKTPTLANQSSCISSSGKVIQTKRWLGSPSATSTVPIRWYSSSANSSGRNRTAIWSNNIGIDCRAAKGSPVRKVGVSHLTLSRNSTNHRLVVSPEVISKTWKRCYAMNTNEYFYVLRSRVTCSTHI
jgi:hypothetical protein